MGSDGDMEKLRPRHALLLCVCEMVKCVHAISLYERTEDLFAKSLVLVEIAGGELAAGDFGPLAIAEVGEGIFDF